MALHKCTLLVENGICTLVYEYTRMCASTGQLRRIAYCASIARLKPAKRSYAWHSPHSHDALMHWLRGAAFVPRHINHMPTLHTHTAQCSVLVLRIFRLSSQFVLCSQIWPRHTTQTHTHTHTHTHHTHHIHTHTATPTPTRPHPHPPTIVLSLVLSQWEIKTFTQRKFQKVKEL